MITDPDFGNHIVRVTDADTNPENRDRTYATPSSADENIWNLNSTLFLVTDTGGIELPFSFDPSTMQAARMYVSRFPSSGGLVLPQGAWSRIKPNLLYIYTYRGSGSPRIETVDFTNRTSLPSPQLFYSFTTSRNCLPSGFLATSSSPGGVSAGDTVFIATYSNAGGQGTGVYVVAYKVGSGCRVWNTQTGKITGDWGATGIVNIPDRFHVHNVQISKDGNWVTVAPQDCISNCAPFPASINFWQVDSTTVTQCGSVNNCGGHWTEGYTHWVNNDAGPVQELLRPFSNPGFFTKTITNLPAGLKPPDDQHPSWNNVNSSDSNPVLTSTFSTLLPFPSAWYNEVLGVATDGSGKVWRFCHTFATAKSHRFSTSQAIGTVSQDGRFFIFSSDWMGTLGSERGSSSCTVGTNCRGDVFIVELK